MEINSISNLVNFDMNYGRKLTQREYERAVVDLYAKLPKLNEEQLLHDELNLTIDHRLGVDFPEYRREKLWQIQKKIESERLRILMGSVILKFIPSQIKKRSNLLASFVLAEYAKVLSPEEMKDYFE